MIGAGSSGSIHPALHVAQVNVSAIHSVSCQAIRFISSVGRVCAGSHPHITVSAPQAGQVVGPLETRAFAGR